MSTMIHEQERREIEQASQNGQDWSQTLKQVKQVAHQGDRLPQSYKHAVQAVEEATSHLSPQGQTYLNALPPASKASIFEVTAMIAKLAEFAGEQAASEVAGVVCQALQQTAQRSGTRFSR